MERQMSVDERIKRAEERYNSKNEHASTRKIKQKFGDNKKKRNKLVKQIFICLWIYIVFYAIWNWDYVFSEEFRNNMNTTYINLKSYVENNILNNNSEETIEEQDASGEESTENETENTNENSESGVGGLSEDTENTDEISEQEQMQQDAEEIKEKISFINPIEGTITSTFGWRTPTVSTVSKYHTGLDIATSEGTVIKSATDGTIILASTEGDYGNHYQIQIEDVILIYAHCKTLYLNEGDTVVQGQEIAEVGSTGNSTGPHLHFEIRKDERLVDPQLVLDI